MKLIGLARLGRDAETRYTKGGDAVTSFTAAFNYGKKDQEGGQPSQWVKFTIWGERGEKLSQYLLKGTQLFITASEPHIETFEKQDRSVQSTLAARVDDLQFAGPKPDQQGAQRQQPQRQQGQRQAQPAAGVAFDDDIPF